MPFDMVPDIVLGRITEITPELLRELDVGALVCDLDCTLGDYESLVPDDFIIDWANALKASGIKLLVLSNNGPDRVAVFCDKLDVPYISYAKKPFKSGYIQAANKLGLLCGNIAMVGDKIYTDIWGAKRVGMKTLLVEPIGLNKRLHHKLRRLTEIPFIRASDRKRGK